jgi:hypothetical protein
VANTNAPFGLAVYRGGGSYAFNQQGTVYSIPTSDTSNAYYMGDVVKAAASGSTGGTPNVTKITNGTDAIRGAIVGIYQPGMYSDAQPTSIQGQPLTLENNYVPATKAAPYFVLVEDDPTTIFVAQDDGITTANLVAASCNLNASLTITNGATTVSASASVILSSSMATTSSLCLKLLGLAHGPQFGVNNAFGAYAKWCCRINLSELTGSFAGV